MAIVDLAGLAAGMQAGTLFVFARTTDGQVTFNPAAPGGAFVGWQEVPGGVTTDAALAAAGRSDDLFVFAKTTDGRVVFNQAAPGGAFVGWQEVPGGAITDAALAAGMQADTLFVFAKTTDGRVIFNQAAPGGAFVGWQEVPGGVITNVPLAAAGRSDDLFVFAKTTDGRVIFNQAAPGGAFVGWQEVPGGVITDAALAAGMQADTLFVFAKTTDGRVIFNQAAPGGAFVGWQYMPGARPADVNLTGLWQCDDGGTYYVNHDQDGVWWAGLSGDGQFYNGLQFCNVFSGKIDANNRVTGRWADVPRGATSNGGFLSLDVNTDGSGNVTGFTKVAFSGGFGGSSWSNRSDSRPRAPEIFHVFDLVKKNQNAFRDHSLLDNLKPCKVFPVVVFGNVLDALPELGYPLTAGRSYKDFICLYDNNSPPDGDLTFDIQVDETLLAQDFWTDGWQTSHGVTPANFRAKLEQGSRHLHCEVIMYGRTAECGDDAHFSAPPLLPGWQEGGGDGVLIDGFPIEGNLGLSRIDDNTCSVETVHGFPTLRAPTPVRVTGILALDCGHGLAHDCNEDDPNYQNQEIHPLLAIDIIDATPRDNLTGAWADRLGLTYYVRHLNSEIWWLAMSPALDDRLAWAFQGTVSADGGQIQGMQIFLPLGTDFTTGSHHPPLPFSCLVDPGRLKLLFADGSVFLSKLYDRGEGRIDP